MDWTAYWYMFPVALAVATLANATGIEGATFFSPIFILILKLDPRIAIGTALITEVFGFGSGVSAYMRRKLIDYRLAGQLLLVTVPLAVIGSYFAGQISPTVLKIIFGVGLLIIGVSFFLHTEADHTSTTDPAAVKQETRTHTTAAGETFHYSPCNQTEGRIITGIGGVFMGLIGSGQGEVNGYFFLKRCNVPGKIALGTGAFIVAITALAASIGHAIGFIASGGEVLNQVLSLVIYTVPAVIIGGQLGPALAARLDTHKVERLLAVVFIIIGVITLWTVF